MTGVISSKSNLNSLSEQILNTWEERVRSKVDSAGELLRPVLRDNLPKFLTLLSEALSEPDARGLIEESSALVKNHAAERARETRFGASEILQEFQILRSSVTHVLEQDKKLSSQEYETIQLTFDEAIQEALLEFFKIHTKLREQFTATLSHDLRNPIGVGQMAAEALKESAESITDPQLRDEIQDFAQRIISNMKRADHMIRDLLDASRLEIGEKIPMQISECELLSLTNEVVNEIEEQDRKRIKIMGNNLSGYWDREGIRRTLENLIKNAIKYGATETPITVSISRGEKGVRIAVHNLGNPISKQDQNLIFKNFTRSKSAQIEGQQGWGLGLAFVKAIAESLGGTVSVNSSPDEGTTFIVELPVDSRTPFQLTPTVIKPLDLGL